MKYSFWLILLVFILRLPAASLGQSKNGAYADEIFQPYVKSVQLFPETGANGQQLQAPIVSLNQSVPLLLRFDILKDNYDFLRAKIVHCNYDWNKSILNDIDFLREFNLFDLNDYAYSGTAKQVYVNYEFEVPKVKISGNYVLKVFRTDDPDEILFTKRFIIFENATLIQPSVRVSSSPGLRLSHQQIDFTMAHKGIRANNPRSEFKVLIRQNQRWDNVIYDLMPTRIDLANRELEYRPFQGENAFMAGNEFRYFDIRTVTFRGQFVENVNKNNTPIEAKIMLDQSRQGRVYAELNDLNGGFYVDTNEIGADDLDADYINVEFRLKTEPSMEPIYVIGAFNQWKKNAASKMKLDPAQGIYRKTVLLKQGLYDYQYWVDGENPLRHDGSYFQANNQYEILVYHRSFNDLYDRVVGYRSFIAQL